MPGWESPQEKDVVDQSISNGCIAVQDFVGLGVQSLWQAQDFLWP